MSTETDKLNSVNPQEPSPPVNGFSVGNHLTNQSNNFLEAQEDEAKILDLIDQLRDLRGEEIQGELPQVIVCGAQSSGKSSVLRAITGIPFPKAEGTCTRFVTRVTLAHSKSHSVEVRISPSQPDDARAARLRAFSEKTEETTTLPTFLERAFQRAYDAIYQDIPSERLFTGDTVLVNIRGPDRRPIQLLDLPGLMGADREGEKHEVQRIVRDHMSKEHTLILAVIKATEDVNGTGAEVLAWCRGERSAAGTYEAGFDPNGRRTIGVLTCPDHTEARRNQWMKVLRGEPAFGYNNQWHVVRNSRPEEDMRHRDSLEEEFFAEGPWSDIIQEKRGVFSLKERVRKWLFEKSKAQLPKLRKRLKQDLEMLVTQLRSEGAPLHPDDLVRIFRERTITLRERARDHARGIYEDDIIRGFPIGSNAHLRSRVVEEGEGFRDNVIRYGHKWKTLVVPPLPDQNPDLMSIAKSADVPSEWQGSQTRYTDEDQEVADWKEKIQKRRGREIQGEISIDHINYFFWEMSDSWVTIGRWHAERIFGYCLSYFEVVTSKVFEQTHGLYGKQGFSNSTEIGQRIIAVYIRPELERRRFEALCTLQDLEEDRRSPLINYELSYLARRRDFRNRRKFRSTMKAQEAIPKKSSIDPTGLARAMNEYTQDDDWREKTVDFLHAMWEHYMVGSLHPPMTQDGSYRL